MTTGIFLEHRKLLYLNYLIGEPFFKALIYLTRSNILTYFYDCITSTISYLKTHFKSCYGLEFQVTRHHRQSAEAFTVKHTNSIAEKLCFLHIFYSTYRRNNFLKIPGQNTRDSHHPMDSCCPRTRFERAGQQVYHTCEQMQRRSCPLGSS